MRQKCWNVVDRTAYPASPFILLRKPWPCFKSTSSSDAKLKLRIWILFSMEDNICNFLLPWSPCWKIFSKKRISSSWDYSFLVQRTLLTREAKNIFGSCFSCNCIHSPQMPCTVYAHRHRLSTTVVTSSIIMYAYCPFNCQNRLLEHNMIHW